VWTSQPPLLQAEEVKFLQKQKLNPAAWGSDHVGKELPEYVTGDECLFCHRDIGPSWPDNRHQLTLRLASRPSELAVRTLRQHVNDVSMAEEVTFLLGEIRNIRFLKRSHEYGKLELLSAKYVPPSSHLGRLATVEDAGSAAEWNPNTFGQRCAGCHATAVDTATQAFAATSIDCFACHGAIDLAHTSEPKLALLSKQNRDSRQVISTCGQCHLRGGKSLSSGRPYANTFVPGDNLFRDFTVDLSIKAINTLTAVEKHIFQNSRDVVILGQDEMTCLTCHDVHSQQSDKHQALDNVQLCASCHVSDSANFQLCDAFLESRGLATHSQTCDY
jgi:predicted CXXCH cytochrome family protein